MWMMNQNKLAACLVIAGAAVAVIVGGNDVAGYHDEAEESALALHMEALGDSMRSLRSELRDPNANASSADIVASMITHAVACKSLTPPTAQALSGSALEKHLLAYRLQMIELMSQLLSMEAALLENRHEDAQTIYKTIKKLQKPAHDQFELDD